MEPGRSAARALRRWDYDGSFKTELLFCTQSKKESHFKEDLNVFDFTLTDDEMAKVSQLPGPFGV